MTERPTDHGTAAAAQRVAVVDDRAFVRAALASALGRAGLDVIEVDPVGDLVPDCTGTVVLLGEVGPGVHPSAGVDIRGCRSVDDVLRVITPGSMPSPEGTDSVGSRQRLQRKAGPPLGAYVGAGSSTSGLTPRERTILQAVGEGGSAAQIAADFGISARTVERHKQSVMTKLGVRNQAGAVAQAAREHSRRG